MARVWLGEKIINEVVLFMSHRENKFEKLNLKKSASVKLKQNIYDTQ